MMRKRRLLALFLAFSLGVGALSACGDKGDKGSSIQNPDTSVQTPDASSGGSSNGSGEHEHVFSEEWSGNSSYHWHACTVEGCTEKESFVKHSGEALVCNSKAICSTCGREYGKEVGHTYGALQELEGGVKGFGCEKCDAYLPLVTTETEEGVLDFCVEVEAGRDPVILQLSDTQFMDMNGENKCYKYVRETVAETNPDLILITGDLVYGRFDKDGAIFLDFIEFMETLNTPWAPVFGNHDNECWLGVDWQCEQLEAAENCLFKQGNVTGNGNYTVGVMQGNKLLRAFYMMDSNGCSSPRVYGNGEDVEKNMESTPGKNLVKTSAGFDGNQVTWFTNSIKELKEVVPDVKISFAYHIQQAYFVKAYEQYGYNGQLKEGSSSELKNPLNFDTMEDAKEGDIGYLSRTMKGPWDTSFSVFATMKNLGVDSIFVGHEHCNSASVVFNGVRFQFGQKSSTYDRYNALTSQGEIIGDYDPEGTPLIGGTAFYLSQEDGAIINPYIYLYGDPLGMNPKKA
ncbi:MAG: metallophosphoesterase [Clostridia bacterium]|nr:metallophosphoesterase [Clostridia bacterium]